MTRLSVKDELHRLIDDLTDEGAERVRDLIYSAFDSDELTPEEEEAVREARAEIARGEYVTLEELEAELGL